MARVGELGEFSRVTGGKGRQARMSEAAGRGTGGREGRISSKSGERAGRERERERECESVRVCVCVCASCQVTCFTRPSKT